MSPRNTRELLVDLTKWEADGWFDERCERIAAGASLRTICLDYCIPSRVFYQWIAEEPERQAKLDRAIQQQAEMRQQQKNEKKESAAQRRETLKLYLAMQGASKEAWQRAGRLLKVNLPPRPGDIEQV